MTDTLHEHQPTTIRIDDVVPTGPIAPRVLNAAWPNVFHTRISEIVAQKGPPPWAVLIIADERNLVTLIATAPGAGNRPHWHRDFDEWWVVMGGQLEWELSGGHVVHARKDDIVWVPRGSVHHIRTVGNETSLRLAVAMPPAVHIYHDCEQCGYSQDGPAEWTSV
ncbi:MAG: cupin domain-containing protein [Chloroflexi bacterium]|nr:cupin domain-containing protein [Chloroflexota bacterium]